jgi:hypothetical protein
MRRQRTDINIYQGNDQFYIFLIKDENDDPVNYSGATVTFNCKQDINDLEPLFIESAHAGTDLPNGLVVVKITNENSDLLRYTGTYDLTLVTLGGDVETVVFGAAILDKKSGE